MNRNSKKWTGMILAVLLTFFSAVPAAAAPEIRRTGANYTPVPQIAVQDAVPADGAALPSSYTSVGKYISKVKDQGIYNTCSFFSVCAAMEASAVRNKVKIGSSKATTKLDLSESQLAYFFYHRKTDALKGTSGDKAIAVPSYFGGSHWYDVGGNTLQNAFHLLTWSGPVRESKAKYSTTMGKKLKSSLAYKKDILHVQGFEMKPMDDIAGVKKLIRKYGAVAVNYYHNSLDEYQFYNYTTNAYFCPYSYDFNHSVAIVGWDDHYSRDNFVIKPANDGAWIVKGQWGPVWGKNGYYYVSYEDIPLLTSANQANYATAFKVEKKNNYKYNYQYDGGTAVGEIYSANCDSFTLANTFKAVGGGKEKLKAVGFGVWSEGVRYKIQIYRNSKKGKPFSGKKLLSKAQTGVLGNAGFYTVKLKKAVKLKKGYTYTVAVKFSGPQGCPSAMTDAADHYGWIKAVTKQKAGVSYYHDKDGLEDLSKARYYGVLDRVMRRGMTARIKMYTTK